MINKEVKQIGSSIDIVLYSYIFTRTQNSFTMQDIKTELYRNGLTTTNEDIYERLARFISLGFIDKEYQHYVRCSID